MSSAQSAGVACFGWRHRLDCRRGLQKLQCFGALLLDGHIDSSLNQHLRYYHAAERIVVNNQASRRRRHWWHCGARPKGVTRGLWSASRPVGGPPAAAQGHVLISLVSTRRPPVHAPSPPPPHPTPHALARVGGSPHLPKAHLRHAKTWVAASRSGGRVRDTTRKRLSRPLGPGPVPLIYLSI